MTKNVGCSDAHNNKVPSPKQRIACSIPARLVTSIMRFPIYLDYQPMTQASEIDGHSLTWKLTPEF